GACARWPGAWSSRVTAGCETGCETGCDTGAGDDAGGSEMTTRHPRRSGRRSAEQLLSGHGGSDAEHDRLAGVLAAAAGPARESELGGEHAAVAAFEAHHL